MKNIHTSILYCLLIGVISWLIYQYARQNTMVYVDNVELFNGFEMKTQLEKKYKDMESARKSILDSIYKELILKSEAPGINDQDESLRLLKKEFLMKKQAFEKQNEETMSQYNEQIWNQLNEYTSQYGSEQHVDFIFGANGQGVLMYAKKSKNVTKDLIQYANKKFNGQ